MTKEQLAEIKQRIKEAQIINDALYEAGIENPSSERDSKLSADDRDGILASVGLGHSEREILTQFGFCCKHREGAAR